MFKHRLKRENTRFFIVDIQDKLLPNIPNADEIIHNSLRLLKLASLCAIQTDYSEQYPKGLGATDLRIKWELPEKAILLEKTHFACGGENGFDELIRTNSAPLWVIWGIETHICLLGTVMDLIERGFSVIVPADACGSRDETHSACAFAAMRDCGALVLPTETIAYHLLEQSGTDEFKTMLPFFK